MSRISRLVDPNPPLNATQVQAAVAAALGAFDFSGAGQTASQIQTSAQAGAAAALGAFNFGGVTLPSQIKSIQTGVVTMTFNDSNPYVDVTVTAVDLAKSMVVINWRGQNNNDSGGKPNVLGFLSSTTTLRLERSGTYGTVSGWIAAKVRYQIIEFK